MILFASRGERKFNRSIENLMLSKDYSPEVEKYINIINKIPLGKYINHQLSFTCFLFEISKTKRNRKETVHETIPSNESR